MKEQDVSEKISKAVNLVAQVALVASAVNEFAVKFVEHAPYYIPIVAGVLAGATNPVVSFGLLFGRLFGKK